MRWSSHLHCSLSPVRHSCISMVDSRSQACPVPLSLFKALPARNLQDVTVGRLLPPSERVGWRIFPFVPPLSSRRAILERPQVKDHMARLGGRSLQSWKLVPRACFLPSCYQIARWPSRSAGVFGNHHAQLSSFPSFPSIVNGWAEVSQRLGLAVVLGRSSTASPFTAGMEILVGRPYFIFLAISLSKSLTKSHTY